VERKTTTAGVELKNPDRGEFSAVIASFGVRDHDGDVVLREAFAGEEGKGFPVSAYGHTSWSGALPVGHATLHTTATEAVVTGSFFMESTAGRDTWAVVKALHDRGITQEWSWGFECLDSENGTLDGQSVKFLKSVRIFEASPVLRASGSNTRTVAVKAAGSEQDVFIKELLHFVGAGLDHAIREELADIAHALDLAMLRDRHQAELFEIRRRYR
jgi:hypothetical protein